MYCNWIYSNGDLCVSLYVMYYRRTNQVTFSIFQSNAIGDAAYETVWYDLSPRECRILLFVILRSQKRLTITAGKVMDLTLEGFTSVSSLFSTLYSFILWLSNKCQYHTIILNMLRKFINICVLYWEIVFGFRFNYLCIISI